MESMQTIRNLLVQIKGKLEERISTEAATVHGIAAAFTLQRDVRVHLQVPPEKRREDAEADRLRRREERLKRIHES